MRTRETADGGGCPFPARREAGAGADARVDYIAVKDAETLSDVRTLEGSLVIALAVFFGATRLIDNIEVTVT